MLRRSRASPLPRSLEGDVLAQARPWLVLALLLALAGCAPSDQARVAICHQALSALEPDARALAVLDAQAPDTVVVRYRLQGRELELSCRFAPRGLESDGLDLQAVRLGHDDAISPSVLFLLKTYGLGRGDRAVAASLPAWAYLAQQLVNGLAPAAIYALLATGYALIYGLTGRINLAFGEFTTVGAFAALAGIVAATGLGAALPGLAAAGLAVAAVTGGALGAVLHTLVFGPLARRSSQALLIATIGLAIALGEALRLLTASRQRWLQPFFTQPFAAGPLVLNPGQAALAALALTTIAGVALGLRRTAAGRAYRACSDDPQAAALVGVDIDRVTRWTCIAGSMLAAIAGFAIATHYGVVSFAMGTLWGLKALTAAVVGGIGSAPGAALGGVLIAMFESLWAGYLPSDYKDVAVFAVLAIMLTLRPNGLLGQSAATDNPMLWRSRSGG